MFTYINVRKILHISMLKLNFLSSKRQVDQERKKVVLFRCFFLFSFVVVVVFKYTFQCGLYLS